MHDQEKQETDLPGDDDDADDAVKGDNVPSPRLSTEAMRSKSEQDLARAHSLDLLMPNGQAASVSGLTKRAASCDVKLIVMEEVAPMRTPLRSVLEEDDISKSWQLPLFHFTSKRRGSQKDDQQLARSVRRYYKKQDELISAYEGIHLDNSKLDSESTRIRLRRQATRLAKLSFFMNFLLLCGKLAAAILSGSLSVITSVIDSAVDLVSGILMWWSTRAVKYRDPYLYPQGRTKLEPVAIVVLSVIMSLASIQMMRQSVERIVAYAQYDIESASRRNGSMVLCVAIDDMEDYVPAGSDSRPVFELDSILICVVTVGCTTYVLPGHSSYNLPKLINVHTHEKVPFVSTDNHPTCAVKFILYIVCRRVPNPMCRALANDHRNDVVSNTAAVACGIIGLIAFSALDE